MGSDKVVRVVRLDLQRREKRVDFFGVDLCLVQQFAVNDDKLLLEAELLSSTERVEDVRLRGDY